MPPVLYFHLQPRNGNNNDNDNNDNELPTHIKKKVQENNSNCFLRLLIFLYGTHARSYYFSANDVDDVEKCNKSKYD